MTDPLASSGPTRSKRLLGWVCNVLATALVLTAGLLFGRQVMLWWRADAALVRANQEGTAVLGSDAMASAAIPLDMELGDWPCALRREDFTGDRAAARAELRRLCEASLNQATFPKDTPGPAEVRMLAGLARQTPFKVLPDGWQLYEQDGPLPLVAAVGVERSGGSAAIAPQSPVPAAGKLPEATREVASPARRVVSWGLGIHLAGTRWTLLLLTAQAKSPVGDHRWATLLPPGAKRSLSLTATDRESIVAFTGRGPREVWQQFYDEQLASVATSQLEWQQVGVVWRQRYETPSATVEVVFALPTGEDEIQGLLTILSKRTATVPGE